MNNLLNFWLKKIKINFFKNSLQNDGDNNLTKLHLGCGRDVRDGWINIDISEEYNPDIVSSVTELKIFSDDSVDLIEAMHLFEHLDYYDAHLALREWHRVLANNGKLCLELPNIQRCFQILGKYKDDYGFDIGTIGIYGFPPEIKTDGVPQIHKWGWTKKTIKIALLEAGFENVKFQKPTQKWRAAYKYNRDMRVVATVVKNKNHKDINDEFQYNIDLEPHQIQQFNNLNPWFFSLRFNNYQIKGAVGATVSDFFMKNHNYYRSDLLVNQVVDKYDFQNKSVLELASNCGYWSSRFVQHGANEILGIEGRDLFIKQAKFLWNIIKILPKSKYNFIKGDISKKNTWTKLKRYDFILCAGILYHIPNYKDVIKFMASNAKEAFVIDTRVSESKEILINEPGDLKFNAIESTREKTIPRKKDLVNYIRSLGFSCEKLKVNFGSHEGVNGPDDYSIENRIALFCKKI